MPDGSKLHLARRSAGSIGQVQGTALITKTGQSVKAINNMLKSCGPSAHLDFRNGLSICNELLDARGLSPFSTANLFLGAFDIVKECFDKILLHVGRRCGAEVGPNPMKRDSQWMSRA